MTPRQHMLAIVDPTAGRGRGARLVRKIASEFERAGTVLEVAVSPGPGEAARLAAAGIDDGYRSILAVGGDGTANEVANGMIGSNAVLALYPVGAGNDLARSLGYPRGRRRRQLAKWLATDAVPFVMDVGEVNGRIFLGSAGVGIDGHLAARVRSNMQSFGERWSRVLGAIASFGTYRPEAMEVRLDGDGQIGRYLGVVASNTMYAGGGMKIAPRARMDDGWLDVTVAGEIGRGARLGALARAYFGKHENGGTILTRRARHVEVDLERPLEMQVDGDVARVDHLRIGLRPAALTVLAAARRPGAPRADPP